MRDQVIALRKQNLSIYDISRVLAGDGCTLSAATIAQMLKAEGFAACRAGATTSVPNTPIRSRRPRRCAGPGFVPAQRLTRFGGLFLFLPWLARIPLPALLQQAHPARARCRRPAPCAPCSH